MYDDEGPTDTPTEVPPSAVVLQVTGYDAKRIEEMVAEKLTDWAREQVRALLEQAVMGAVESATADLVREKVGAEIDRVLVEGWQPTGEYGEARGTKKTLKDRISDLLNHQDRYSSNRRWLEEMIADRVREVFKGPFAEEVEKAKASFRKQVDDLLSGHIAKGLRDAFGLRS